VSKYLPGPGSHIMKQELEFPKPVYHYDTVQFLFEVKNIDSSSHLVTIDVIATNEQEETVIRGSIDVCPPHKLEKMNGSALENF
jgi:3-hydroxybutyryl-CoA dehydratase